MSKGKAIAFVALLWLLSILLTAAAAKASTKQDALKATWYLRGEGDAVLPSIGLTITSLKCAPTHNRFVACKLRTTDGHTALCSSGKMLVKAHAVIGQLTKPKPCLTS